MPTNRKVIDFKIHNLTEEQFQELKEAGQIDPNAIYCTPDETVANFEAVNARIDEAVQTEQQHNIEINARVDETVVDFEELNEQINTANERIDSANEQINTKQDVATAINYGHVTNCLTEIPQDIKLELNNGTLRLKAGSKVYVPNGAGNFDELVIQNDLTTITSWGQQVQLGLFVKSDGSTMFIINMRERCSSGSTPPTATNTQIWYDTTNNLVKRYGSGSDTGDRYSLPIALVQKGDAVESSNISSIDQVFNGFGYIGSTLFVLPGVKGLIPNGRNEDGTLKNITANNASVKTVSGWIANSETIQIATDGTVYTSGSLYYDPKQNICLNHRGEQTLRLNAGAVIFGTNGKITFFESKTAFHAVDYSNTEFIANQAMPSSKYVDFTLGASGTQYTAPADGYMCCVISTTINGFLSMYSNYWQNGSADGAYVGGWVPVRKGAAINVFYEGLIQVIEFRFRYAVGAK